MLVYYVIVIVRNDDKPKTSASVHLFLNTRFSCLFVFQKNFTVLNFCQQLDKFFFNAYVNKISLLILESDGPFGFNESAS